MKKIIIFLLAFMLFVNSFQTASAHFLATDGNIGAELHIEPNDEPVVGLSQTFFFALKDKNNQLTPGNCDCTFVIEENKKTLYMQPIFQNTPSPSLSSATASYAFPRTGVYTVKLIGKPLSDNAFQPFTLTWNFTVTQKANTTNTPWQLLPWGIGISIFLCCVIVGLNIKRKTTKKKEKDTQVY